MLHMKTLVARLLVAFVVFAGTALAFAGDFKSKIITTQPLVITVPDDHFLKITNFTQEGGTERALVQVTLQGDTESTGTTNVLTATRIDFSSGVNSQNFPEIDSMRLIVAGPAQVRVAPVAGATLFISYRKEPQGSSGGGGGGRLTPTPFPIFQTPTPTPTIPGT
jgi:hypothetical protein